MPGKDTWDNIIRVRKLILFNHVNWYQAHFFGQWGVTSNRKCLSQRQLISRPSAFPSQHLYPRISDSTGQCAYRAVVDQGLNPPMHFVNRRDTFPNVPTNLGQTIHQQLPRRVSRLDKSLASPFMPHISYDSADFVLPPPCLLSLQPLSVVHHPSPVSCPVPMG